MSSEVNGTDDTFNCIAGTVGMLISNSFHKYYQIQCSTTTYGPWLCDYRKRNIFMPRGKKKGGNKRTLSVCQVLSMFFQTQSKTHRSHIQSGRTTAIHPDALFQVAAHGWERQSISVKFNISWESFLWISYLSPQVPPLGPSM